MIKAARFISIFSLLTFFGFGSVFSQNDFCFMSVHAQEKIETKTTETPKPVVKPVLVNKPTERYRIGLQDVLDVIVARQPLLSVTGVKMDSEGKIRLPRIDRLITAACKTENELAIEIQNLYKENYLRDPFVMVNVREQNSQPFSIMGAVKKPGYYVTNRPMTLLDLLGIAGGPDVEFAGTKITVARVGGISGCVDESENEMEGDVAFYTFKLDDVIKQRTNPIMKPGDIVYMNEFDQAFISGNVKEGKALPLKQEMTLSQAIAAAGGTLPATKKKEVLILRHEPNGEKKILTFDLVAIESGKSADPILQANDVIKVQKDGTKSLTQDFIKAITNGIPNIFFRF